MYRPRVLVIAEAANPEWVSVPLVGWSHAIALRDVADIHIVTQIRNRDAFVRAGLREGSDFTAIDSEAVAARIHKLANMVRRGTGGGWTTGTAMGIVSYYYFEHLLWKIFGCRIKEHEFDVVHRITPLSPTQPSIIAKRCRDYGVPFVLGPLNGGVPWPIEFDAQRRKEGEWLSYVRSLYKVVPGYRSTRKNASAIIVGSSVTLSEIPDRYHVKCVYCPENGIDPALFKNSIQSSVRIPLRIAFVGRLVPLKGVDMLIEAAAPLAREGKLIVDILGDGPEMQTLKILVRDQGLTDTIRLVGWVPHEDLPNKLMQSDIFVFPSIREFGGGVVLEAMALGLVPVVVDYAGPSELVTTETGYRIPLGSRKQLIERFRNCLAEIMANPSHLRTMGIRARRRAVEQFAWTVKAKQTLEVYEWVLGRRDKKPDFGMPFPDPSEPVVDDLPPPAIPA